MLRSLALRRISAGRLRLGSYLKRWASFAAQRQIASLARTRVAKYESALGLLLSRSQRSYGLSLVQRVFAAWRWLAARHRSTVTLAKYGVLLAASERTVAALQADKTELLAEVSRLRAALETKGAVHEAMCDSFAAQIVRLEEEWKPRPSGPPFTPSALTRGPEAGRRSS